MRRCIIKCNGTVLFMLMVYCILPVKSTFSDESPFIATKPKIHSVTIDSASHDYNIILNGTADMDNTTTRGYPSYEVAFQPNISLSIENVGTNPVIDPWVVINGVRDWRTIDAIVEEATRDAADEQERLMLIYEFARSHRYHDNPLFTGDEMHDPVKHFTMYGAGFCDDIGRVTCALAYHAGFTEDRHGGDPVIRSMHGHVMSEIAVDGHYQFIDTDENAFYLDPENMRPVSGDEIVLDSDLAGREYTYGPLFRSWKYQERAAALLGRDDSKGRSITIGHEMHLTLRPDEKLTLRWDNIGKTPGPKTLKYFANSFLDYEPEMNETCIDNAYDISDVAAGDGSLYGLKSGANITFSVESPYVMCGGKVDALFECGRDTDTVSVAVSIDEKHWMDVWRQSGKGTFTCSAALDDSLGVKTDTPCYRYYVRIGMSSENGSARLTGLKLHTDLLASLIALPRLSLGENSIHYTDKNTGPRKIRVTHTYQESSNITPPQHPQLLHPADKAVSGDAWIEFTWNEVPDADKYHVRVSRRPDLRTSYRPCFDVVIDSTTFVNRRTGLFNPGENYYWSARARNSEGVWGDWSPARAFSWIGPCPPVELKTLTRGGKLYLVWQPNPRGNRPDRYEVYASDIKGFKPCKTSHEVLTLGEMPPNFIGETPGNEFLIVSSDPSDNAPNKSSYRVLAVDANGTSGGSSWPVELKHPFIYSIPQLEVRVGERYEYSVLTLESHGDLQYRYQEPGYGFREREGYEFYLTEAPVWIRMNPKTGVMTGTPGEFDTGEAQITVEVSRTWPYELTTDDFRPEYFTKDGSEFQANDEQEFVVTVRR